MLRRFLEWLLPKKENGTDSLLNKWSEKLPVTRKYYGDDKYNRPECECFWDPCAYMVGWYETDESLRARMLRYYTKEAIR